MSVRVVAAKALVDVLVHGKSLDVALNQRLESVHENERAQFKSLCFGFTRHYFSLENILKQLLSKGLKNKDTDIKVLIMLGIFELEHQRTPEHAVINETVNAAKKLKKHWATKLVNASLRNFLRRREELTQRTQDSLSARFNHPEWLINSLQSAWPEKYQDILSSNNIQAPLTLRVNQQVQSRESYATLLEKAQVEYSLCCESKVGIQLKEACDITQLPGFLKGAFSVQDEAAQLSASLLDLKPGQRVLDACCAPGGKTCHIAETENALSALLALDIEEKRLTHVRENLQRLKLKADVICAAAQNIDQWWDGQAFDRILLDAPCSATGVIRRHPDIKLLRRESDIQQLAALQGVLLEALWPTLKPGGLLVYATCSILPAENENSIASFLEQHQDATEQIISADWGTARPHGRQLFPQINANDGFYYAVLQKKPEKSL